MRNRFFASIATCLVAILGFACTSGRLLRMRSLSTTTDPRIVHQSSGDFDGIKSLLTAGASNINIVAIHGMGWMQKKGTPEFGRDLSAAIEDAFPGRPSQNNDPQKGLADSHCRFSTLGEPPPPKPRGTIHLRLHRASPAARVSTDDPALALAIDDLGCLDRTIIPVNSHQTITLYRYFWDDAMWDQAEQFLLGFDPPFASTDSHRGYDDMNRPRAAVNIHLKTGIVTYGFSDATLYLGPVGAAIRDGVRASLCIAVSGAFEELSSGMPLDAPPRAADVWANSACERKPPASPQPLLLISHSLGSRILFDTLVTDLDGVLAGQLEKAVSNDVIEVHMFANQLPLEALGRLQPIEPDSVPRSKPKIQGKSLRLVAYSEVNDLLTYELVPYFEQLYYLRCSGANPPRGECELDEKALDGRSADRSKGVLDTSHNVLQWRRDTFFSNAEARKALVSSLGFDVVDVRLKFAPGLFQVFRNPASAHSNHLEYTIAKALLLCGAKNGHPRESWADCAREHSTLR